jgi:hypothetical protein
MLVATIYPAKEATNKKYITRYIYFLLKVSAAKAVKGFINIEAITYRDIIIPD